ncbi:acetolactate synthase small subunit [Halalkalibacterium halodurans]|jgi:acetolactate synthase-1/3 small subunit|uniref:Acetolactate synthase small subunit n=2 Tax=Halalkalibacterium halodurans TaxID=86665 RepID=Q9K8E6_HALH5|nr:acetolactate synthase small subunit [Halalkalibacterium halodurans]MDY7223606.1 acetolactate synthase small subunit [Halalkalibacterium halodurans]MDY7242827.1 acetolactate synthase small subunit [Halalkalibacterium halodurans]MED3647766.1 acetolactate synthase small subunit [Halalkalibacterium halodurans]MED4082185.1 acetolactate synthase small subunit [Halalkalibacterium halodurans]MED4084492.1 acetolactate synthase small subunit [Halalkalibacterium halodurans]
MKRTITALVNNTSGVLNRITGLFARRHFNIESITVGVTENPTVSRMTFVVIVDNQKNIEQVIKQLHKQVDVLKVKDITDEAIVARELALIKVVASPQQRGEIAAVVNPFRASIIDIGRESMTVQITGDHQKVETFIDLLRPYGIKELARTGITAFKRGSKKYDVEGNHITLIN